MGIQINDDKTDDGTRDAMCFDNPSLESAWKGPDYMSNMILAGSPESATDPSVTEKGYYMAVPGTPTVDGYLDDAYLAHLPKVRIIHGRGTGALKSAVQTMLRRNKHVAKYRPGEFDEGGYGVTIAEFK